MELLEIMKKRRSVRSYTGEPVTDEKLNQILKAGLLSPTSRNCHCWEFIVVRDKAVLKALSLCRGQSSRMLEDADCAVVVIGDKEQSDVWPENCSIAMAHMLLMADSLGIGGCWVQGRLRNAPDGRSAEDYIRDYLHYPEQFGLESILALGIPRNHPAPHEEKDLLTQKIHYEQF